MSDEPTDASTDASTDSTAGAASDPAAGERSSRRPSPTSRARRIGGRPRPAPAPTDSNTDTNTNTVRPGPDRPRPAPPPATPRLTKPKPDKRAPAVPIPATEGAAEEKPGRSRGWLRWIPAMVLGAGVVVLLVLLVIASHGVYWAKPDDSASARLTRQEQVLAAAKKCFAQINTYDYRKLTGLIAQDTQCSTGTFTKDLTKALQTQILKIAPTLHAVQTAQVNRAGIESVSPDGKQVVVLVYGQLSHTNINSTDNVPRVDVTSAVMRMVKVGDKWLVGKVDNDVDNTVAQ